MFTYITVSHISHISYISYIMIFLCVLKCYSRTNGICSVAVMALLSLRNCGEFLPGLPVIGY